MLQTEIESMVTDCIIHMLNNYNTGISQDQFYRMNIVDSTDVTEDDMRAVNDEVIQYCKDNGAFAALPPFEEGAFIDREERRYTHWKVLDVEEDYFRISMDHYPLLFTDTEDNKTHANIDFTQLTHPCWYLACHMIVKVKILTKDEHIAMLKYHPDLIKASKDLSLTDRIRIDLLSDALMTSCHVGGVVESYEHYLPKDLHKIAKKGKYTTPDGAIISGNYVRDVIANTLEYSVDTALASMLFCSSGPILEMFQYINYMLSSRSTSSSTLRKITSVYSTNSTDTELRKERHFGKIKTISVKKPHAVNQQNVHRVYTTISWQRRSHMRHLKSGKVVPVKSATCTRHGMNTSEVPQVIYRA